MLAYTVLFGLLLTSVRAHDHHMNNIAEGEGISQDPIVSRSQPGRNRLEYI
jgi:hypothetical protein